MTDERETPQPNQGGVPVQPPRQGQIDQPKRPWGQPPPDAPEAARRAEELERQRRGTEPPHRDHRGRLTRHGMESALKGGGSVMVPDGHGGVRVVHRLEDLPTDTDLAKGDAVREAQVREALQAQIAHAQGELSKLDAPKPEAGGDDALKAENERLKQELEAMRAGPAPAHPEAPEPEPPPVPPDQPPPDPDEADDADGARRSSRRRRQTE
jgi:hypothetical protein